MVKTNGLLGARTSGIFLVSMGRQQAMPHVFLTLVVEKGRTYPLIVHTGTPTGVAGGVGLCGSLR